MEFRLCLHTELRHYPKDKTPIYKAICSELLLKTQINTDQQHSDHGRFNNSTSVKPDTGDNLSFHR